MLFSRSASLARVTRSLLEHQFQPPREAWALSLLQRKAALRPLPTLPISAPEALQPPGCEEAPATPPPSGPHRSQGEPRPRGRRGRTFAEEQTRASLGLCWAHGPLPPPAPHSPACSRQQMIQLPLPEGVLWARQHSRFGVTQAGCPSPTLSVDTVTTLGTREGDFAEVTQLNTLHPGT